MSRHFYIYLSAFISLCLPALLYSQEEGQGTVSAGTSKAQRIEAEGEIAQVTLYQGSALVTRKITVPASAKGLLEILVAPLPSATDPATPFVDKAGNLSVRSVSCYSRPREKEEERLSTVSKLDADIRQLEEKIATSRNEIALRRIRQGYLRSLENFVAPAATQEMTHGVLQAEELEKVTQMHFREYEKASQEIMKLDFEIEKSRKTLQELNEERRKLASGPPVTYQAVVYLEKTEGAAETFNLNYLVKDCGWSPVYNVRADSESGALDIELNALIHQVSGETWGDTGLTLSTASPSVSAYTPQLTPLYVQVTRSTPRSEISLNEFSDNRLQQQEYMSQQLAGRTIEESAVANFNANEYAANIQLIELSERLSKLRQLTETSETEDLSIEYSLPNSISLISRREGQMIPVLQHKTEAEFYHVATPVLTPSVSREAKVINTSEHNLLGGRVNIYLDGSFIGRTEVSTIARGRSFVLGFGIDGQLRARRALVDRDDRVQGGNRLVNIEIQTVIDNFKSDPVQLYLRERTPHMEDATSLRVTLGEMSHPLSKDVDYKRFEKPKGILRWDIQVPSGTGDKATQVKYAYSLEFDRQLTLQDISTEEKSRHRAEFLEKSKKNSIPKKFKK